MATDLTAPDRAPSILSSAAAATIMDALEQEVGGRTQLVEALLAAPPDDALDYVVGLIADPRNDCRNLATLCAEGSVDYREFLEAFKRGVMAPAIARALAIAAKSVPAITADMVARAVVHDVDCDACRGSGIFVSVVQGVQTTSSCAGCAGMGRVTVQPDFERQKFVLEKLAQMGPVKGPVVAITDNSKHLTMDVSAQAHAKLLSAADKILYGRREDPPTIEADPVYPPPDAPPDTR